jgi:hypothetical protein
VAAAVAAAVVPFTVVLGTVVDPVVDGVVAAGIVAGSSSLASNGVLGPVVWEAAGVVGRVPFEIDASAGVTDWLVRLAVIAAVPLGISTSLLVALVAVALTDAAASGLAETRAVVLLGAIVLAGIELASWSCSTVTASTMSVVLSVPGMVPARLVVGVDCALKVVGKPVAGPVATLGPVAASAEAAGALALVAAGPLLPGPAVGKASGGGVGC